MKKIVLILLLIPSLCWGSWVPPAGIPAPSFGIDDVTPTTDGSGNNAWCPNWPSAANTSPHVCYYIDNDHAQSTDTANDYGYPAKPRKTIPYITGAAAGTFIDVHGGTTTPYEEVRISGVGTSSAPIVVTGKNAAAKPKFGYTFTVGYYGSSEYVIIENLHFVFTHGVDYSDGLLGRSMVKDATLKYISFRNNYVECTGSAGDRGAIRIYKDSDYSGQIPEQVVIYNNTQTNCGNWQSYDETDNDGGISAMAKYAWVVDNTVEHCGVDGIFGGHGANRTLDHYYIGRNTVYQCRENCIDIKEINNVIISENVCHGQRPHGHLDDLSVGEGIVIHTSTNPLKGPNEVWVLFNTVYDSGYGVYINGTGGTAYIIGNLFYDMHTRAYNTGCTGSGTPISCCTGTDTGTCTFGGVGILAYDMLGVYVIDNTIYDFDIGVSFDTTASSSNYYVLHGNIISNRSSSAGTDVYVQSGTSYVTVDHNLIYKGSMGTVKIGWAGTNYTTVADWTACTSCVEGDPVFVTPGTDFSIQTSSPAKDASTLSDTYATFTTNYSLDIRKDKAGTTRPYNALWDIGAYEYFTGGKATLGPNKGKATIAPNKGHIKTNP